MTDKIELKPCPFCGELPEYVYKTIPKTVNCRCVDPIHFGEGTWNAAYCWKLIAELEAELSAKTAEVEKLKVSLPEDMANELFKRVQLKVELRNCHKAVELYKIANRNLQDGSAELALTQALSDARKALESSKKTLISWRDLVAESRGVVGYHLNGDEAPWKYFDNGIETEESIAQIEGVLNKGESK